MKKVFACSMVALVMAMGFTSCKKDNDDDDNNNGTAPAQTFKVRMTDSPGDFLQLNLQVTSVDVYHEGDGWINLSSQTQSMNVLSLTNGTEMQLASKTNMSTGVYSKLRITFASSATIMLVGGGAALNLSWTGNTHQVEININEQVSTSAGANLLLDFNVAQSISGGAGVYSIAPIITIIEDEDTGVKGHVQGAASVMVELNNNQHSYTTYINAQGNFMMKGVEPGTYTASFWASGAIVAHEEDNVIVEQDQMKDMGNVAL